MEQTFANLYEASKLLANPSRRNPQEILQRSFSQVIKETKDLEKTIPVDEESIAKGRAFFAKLGFPPVENFDVFGNIKINDSEGPSRYLNITDVEGHLQEHRDKMIIETIESVQKKTISDFEEIRNKAMKEYRNNIEMDNRIAEERDRILGGNNPDHPMEYASEMYTKENPIKKRVLSYANAVQSLNGQRLQNKDFNVIAGFEKLAEVDCENNKMVGTEPHNVWNLLAWLAGEGNDISEGRREGNYMKAYLSKLPNTPESIELSHHLTNLARQWFERQFVRFVDMFLLKRILTANVGGNPEFGHRLKAFIKIQFKTDDQWNIQNLELAEDFPKWVYIYFLIRSGHFKNALVYVTEIAEKYPQDKKFMKYLEEYVENPHHLLSQATRKEIEYEHMLLKNNGNSVDPYKLALYKLLGRCDIYEDHVNGAINTLEDFMWFQLSLVRENIPEIEYGHGKYTLEDLQKRIVASGPSTFSANGANPWDYAIVLISSLQFERAVSHLYQQEATRLDAVHLAIACAYYGLLRIYTKPIQTDDNIFAISAKNIPEINFDQLVYRYTKVYVFENTKCILNYILLLSLFTPHHGFPNNSMVEKAREYIRRLVLFTKSFKEFLGEATDYGGRKPGLVDTYKALLGITTEADMVNYIYIPLVRSCIEAGLYTDAVKICEVGSDYNEATNILINQLESSINLPILDPPRLNPEDKKWNDELVKFSRELLTRYKRTPNIKCNIPLSKTYTVDTLLNILHFRELYESGRYDDAIQYMLRLNVVPLHDENDNVCQTLRQLKSGDKVIVKCIPKIVRILVDALERLHDCKCTHKDGSRDYDAEHENIRNCDRYARILFRFTGMADNDMLGELVYSNIIVRISRLIDGI
ncbi:Nup93/Nic96-domain-containing protein [Phycomyces blakesleeanus]